ncbi:TIGR01459 family HAD-type hydrolase [Xanthobacter autotrophicus]|uniref:TIGR01459 family HAD-type hydrolase n=1 Tax=Xanthobacter autotrophicus TaxID=280 RepID=UPI0024A69A3E|nr:TIGR01459 family HAD-type hydrolase [Xanthobacter autotrophicus]MDI4656492.1 TIGR01459 family HAD-type hydrolase [Xanthobacter autotrophicus]
MAEHSNSTQRSHPHAPPLVSGLSAFAGQYDLILCDVWGVLHNGVAAFPSACDALTRMRADGASVVLVSNAPRPHPFVMQMLDGLGVPRTAYDAIVTSGDVTREMLAARTGARTYHLGPERDLGLFEGLDLVLTDLAGADLVVVTGLFHDEVETPDDYVEAIAAMKARDLPMICANPDLVVERGEHLIFCSGAIAKAYEEVGGKAIWCGKPYRPIYDTAFAHAEVIRGGAIDRARVLGIGDALRTDIAGANDAGFDSLFISGGIHAQELKSVDGAIPDTESLAELFTGHAHPRGVMPRLTW